MGGLVEIVVLEYRWIVWMVKCDCKTMILWEQGATSKLLGSLFSQTKCTLRICTNRDVAPAFGSCK